MGLLIVTLCTAVSVIWVKVYNTGNGFVDCHALHSCECVIWVKVYNTGNGFVDCHALHSCECDLGQGL